MENVGWPILDEVCPEPEKYFAYIINNNNAAGLALFGTDRSLSFVHLLASIAKFDKNGGMAWYGS
jgi:hypothetical protein